MKDIAMQTYCIHCGLEQYAPAVYSISHGEEPCCWCGKISRKMTDEEYNEALKKLKETNLD
jgi:tRNA U54 and U55 pseudouridine synthase Pus10